MRLIYRSLAVMSVSFILAVCAGCFFLDAFFGVLYAAAGVLALSICIFLIFFRFKFSRVFLCIFLSSLFFLAGLLISGRYFSFETKNIEKYYGKETEIVGVCEKVKYSYSYGGGYAVRCTSVDGEKSDFGMILTTEGEKLYRGECFRARVVFEPFSENSEGYSERVISYSQGYRANAEIIAESYVHLGEKSLGIGGFFEELREKCARRFSFLLDERSAGLYLAAFTGDTDGVSDKDNRNIKMTGTSHLLAVSGMHFTVVVGVFMMFLSRTSLGPVTRYVILIVLSAFYAAFTGFSPSVMRSALMLLIAYFGAMLGRESDSPTTLFLTAAIMLGIYPNLVLSASFWLSVAATLGIVLLSSAELEVFGHIHCDNHDVIFYMKDKTFIEKIVEYTKARFGDFIRMFPATFFSSVVASVAASLFAMPFSIFYFGSVSLAALGATMLLSPVVNVILLSSPLVLLFGNAGFVKVGAKLLCDIFYFVVERLSDIDGVYMNVDYIFVKLILIVFFALAAIMLLLSGRKLPIFAVACAVFLSIFPTAYISERVIYDGVDFSYSTRSGADSVSLRADKGLVVFDMGISSKAGVRCAMQSVGALRENEISAYVVTKVSRSTARCIEYLVSNYDVKEILLPLSDKETEDAVSDVAGIADEGGVALSYYSRGEEFLIDGCNIKVGEYAYLKRSDLPLYSLYLEYDGYSLVWTSASYFEGVASSEFFSREYDTVIFGDYGPRPKKTISPRLDGICNDKVIVGSVGAVEYLGDGTLREMEMLDTRQYLGRILCISAK